MRALGIVVVLVLAAVAIGARWWISSLDDEARRYQQRMATTFVPNPQNEVVVFVRGWQPSELSKILSDFAGMYDLPRTFTTTSMRNGNVTELHFPGDIRPDFLFFLINYLQYPKGFDLKGRSIGVLGRARITPAYWEPDPSLVGKAVEIYVPANDDDYDRVVVRIDDGRAYLLPFSDMQWQPLADPRVRPSNTGL